MTLQEAIDYASAPPSSETEYGTITALTISMHEDLGGVMYGGAWYQTYNPRDPGATFHPDLPLLDWGPSRLDLGLAHAANRWFNRSVPGFSTRGQGGLMLNVAGGGGSMPIDLSVRRDPGLPFLGSLPIGPGVQIEIETLSAPGGSATGGVTLNADENGGLVRAVGPSVRDRANSASYTTTIWIGGRPG